MLVVIYISLYEIIYYTLSPFFFLFQCLNFFLIHENSLYIKAVIFFQLVMVACDVFFQCTEFSGLALLITSSPLKLAQVKKVYSNDTCGGVRGKPKYRSHNKAGPPRGWEAVQDHGDSRHSTAGICASLVPQPGRDSASHSWCACFFLSHCPQGPSAWSQWV